MELGAVDVGDVEETAVEVEGTGVEIKDAALGSEDEFEGDGRTRLWRFRPGSPVTEPDSLSIVEK